LIVVDVKKRGACLEVFTERGREKDFDAGKRMAWRGRYWRGLIVAGIMAAELLVVIHRRKLLEGNAMVVMVQLMK